MGLLLIVCWRHYGTLAGTKWDFYLLLMTSLWDRMGPVPFASFPIYLQPGVQPQYYFLYLFWPLSLSFSPSVWNSLKRLRKFHPLIWLNESCRQHVYKKKEGINPSAGIKIDLSILRSAVSGHIAVLFDIGHIFYPATTSVLLLYDLNQCKLHC